MSEKFQKKIVTSILCVANNSYPRDFQSFFGGVIANVIGNLPDVYWARMMITDPCGIPDCNCHIIAAQTMKALDALREDHKTTLTHRAGKN